MKCRLCGKDLDEEPEDDNIEYDIAVNEVELCWNCWYETTGDDYSDDTNNSSVAIASLGNGSKDSQEIISLWKLLTNT
jgi:hypothetical protein